MYWNINGRWVQLSIYNEWRLLNTILLIMAWTQEASLSCWRGKDQQTMATDEQAHAIGDAEKPHNPGSGVCFGVDNQGPENQGAKGRWRSASQQSGRGKTNEPIQMLISSGEILEEGTLRNNAQWTVRITHGHTAWYLSMIAWASRASAQPRPLHKLLSSSCPWFPHPVRRHSLEFLFLGAAVPCRWTLLFLNLWVNTWKEGASRASPSLALFCSAAPGPTSMSHL